MNYEKLPRSRVPTPFDECAESRLRRMGLLDEDGQPDKDAVAVLPVHHRWRLSSFLMY